MYFDYNIFLIAQKSKNNSQRVAVLAATTTATPDLSMAKKRVTWSHDVNSTPLFSPPVPPPPNNLSRPQSLPVVVSSSEPPPPQDSPQSAVAKLPKQSKARKALSCIKGFFTRNSETAAQNFDELSIKFDDACSSYTLSPMEEQNLLELSRRFNSQAAHV